MSIELKQAAQQALLALEKSQPHPSNPVIGLTNQDFIDHEETIRQLRAAIQQAEAQQPATGEPDEWKLVPIVPTEKMLLAYTGGAVTNAGFRWCRHQWSAMLAAAPAAHPAPSVPYDVVRVPLQVLKDASEALGNFVSDHGWGDADMQAMDNLDAYIARHEANRAAMLAAK